MWTVVMAGLQFPYVMDSMEVMARVYSSRTLRMVMAGFQLAYAAMRRYGLHGGDGDWLIV